VAHVRKYFRKVKIFFVNVKIFSEEYFYKSKNGNVKKNILRKIFSENKKIFFQNIFRKVKNIFRNKKYFGKFSPRAEHRPR
jgi:hypothetical protein